MNHCLCPRDCPVRLIFSGVVKTRKIFPNRIAYLLNLIPLLLLPFRVFPEVGVEARTILLGTHQPLSGPMSSYSDIGRGASVFFQYHNDQGGIHGRQVILLQRDDRFQPKQTMKVVRDLIMKDEVFSLFSGIGREPTQSVVPLLKAHMVPNFFIASDALEWTRPLQHGIFAMLPTAETEARVLGKFIATRHPGKKVIVWFRKNPEFLSASKILASNLRGNPTQYLASKTDSNRYESEWKAIQSGDPRVVVALGPYGQLLEFLNHSPSTDSPVYTGMALADSKLPGKLFTRVLDRLRFLTA